MAGIYIHIPFCRQACTYCDFYFVTRQQMRDGFVERLCQEIDSIRETPFSEERIETVYLGGGTPSLLTAEEVSRIFTHLQKAFRFDISDAAEVTMELNPDDVNAGYLSDLRSLGVTRASMGVQSFNTDRLRFMNRAHDAAQAARALELLHRTGFASFSVDLIYGNPGQTEIDLEEDLNRILEFDPPHISAYSLTVEPRTALGKKVALGRIIPAEDDQVARQFEQIGRRLADEGIYRYEVSNYSKPGFEAVHNTRYWVHENYLGLGPSAHSFWWDEKGASRWIREPDLRRYLSRPLEETITGKESLTRSELAEERLMLGLRTREGVGADELQTRYGYLLKARQREWLRRMQEEGWVRLDGSGIVLTDEGLNIADHLIVELLRRG